MRRSRSSGFRHRRGSVELAAALALAAGAWGPLVRADTAPGAIERVSVRIRDVNGPAGGIDTECRIKVVLSGLPSVVVSHQAAKVEAAVNRALDSAERHVRRSVGRRRTKPLKSARAR